MQENQKTAGSEEGCWGSLLFIGGLFLVLAACLVDDQVSEYTRIDRSFTLWAVGIALLASFVAFFRRPLWRHRVFMLGFGYGLGTLIILLLRAID